jgi:Putative restriction endonuclease
MMAWFGIALHPRVIAMSNAKTPESLSIEEYLAAEEVGSTKSEYIDGWVRAMTGATLRHNQVKTNCIIQLGLLLKGKQCRPYDSDTKVRICRQGIESTIVLPFLGCALSLSDIYDGIEFTATCVQEPDPGYDATQKLIRSIRPFEVWRVQRPVHPAWKLLYSALKSKQE